MAAPRIDDAARALAASGSRRWLLRLVAAVPLTGGALAWLEEREARADGSLAGIGGGSGRRRRRRARHRHDRGKKKKKRTRKAQCASKGQGPVKGNRCCKGLVENAKGRCAVPEQACGTGGPCLVFLTSTTHQGNLGGLAGADSICQQRAQAAGLPGIYMAWLSDSTQSPSTRFILSPGPYRRVDGVTVANNWADLTDGTLAAPITVAENGAVFNDLSFRVWTHTLPNGAAGGALNEHCVNWSSGDIADSGDEGQVVSVDGAWTEFGAGSCNNNFHLYCFQQS